MLLVSVQSYMGASEEYGIILCFGFQKILSWIIFAFSLLVIWVQHLYMQIIIYITFFKHVGKRYVEAGILIYPQGIAFNDI